MRFTKTEKKIALCIVPMAAVLVLIGVLAEDGVKIALWIVAAALVPLDVFANYWMISHIKPKDNPDRADKVSVALVARGGSRIKQFLVESDGEFVGRADGKGVGTITVARGTHELTVRYGKNAPVTARLDAEEGVSIILNLDEQGSAAVTIEEPERFMTEEDKAASAKRLKRMKTYALAMANVMFVVGIARLLLISFSL
jgi:hypothetical protein